MLFSLLLRKADSFKNMKCPKCGKELEIDSVRNHRNGRVRTYWECEKCNLSIMDKGLKKV